MDLGGGVESRRDVWGMKRVFKAESVRDQGTETQGGDTS